MSGYLAKRLFGKSDSNEDHKKRRREILASNEKLQASLLASYQL